MGITKVISTTDKSLPGKWHNVIDSVKVSSQVIHTQLTVLDEDVAKEYYQLEEDLNRRMGKGKLYTRKDLDMAKERINQVNFQNTNKGL